MTHIQSQEQNQESQFSSQSCCSEWQKRWCDNNYTTKIKVEVQYNLTKTLTRKWLHLNKGWHWSVNIVDIVVNIVNIVGCWWWSRWWWYHHGVDDNDKDEYRYTKTGLHCKLISQKDQCYHRLKLFKLRRSDTQPRCVGGNQDQVLCAPACCQGLILCCKIFL